MVEIELEEFEEYYRERLNELFYKERRVARKLLGDMREDLMKIKVCLDRFLEIEDKVDDRAKRSLNLFSDRIQKDVDNIEVPNDDEVEFSNLNKFKNSIKKLFVSINEIGRKSIPKFQKEAQPQIKELNFLTRKLGKRQASLDRILRKKYGDAKAAEDLLEKAEKLFTLRDNIENARRDLDHFERELEERKGVLEELNQGLLELEKNELFRELETEKEKLFKLKIAIKDLLGFNKALKKMKFALEKENLHIPNIDTNYLKNFLKNPISTLRKDTKDFTTFRAMLVHLRRVLEENKLNLKTETKEKTIEQINQIFDERELQDSIEELTELNAKIKNIQKKIKDKGLADKLTNIKNDISVNTVKLEHTENDLKRKNKDYLRYLASLKKEREEYQNALEKILGEPVKINITFNF